MDNSFKITDLLGKVQLLGQSRRVDQAINLLNECNELVDLSPDLLVEKGKLIQLSSDDINLTLDDAVMCFKKALSLNEFHIGALSELGWYYLNVEDDAKEAKPYFDLALNNECVLDNYIEIFKGIIDCLVELEGVESAIKKIESNDKLSEKQKNDFVNILNNSEGVVFWC